AWPGRARSLVLADTASEYSPEARRQLAERARIAEERGIAPLIEPTLERWFTPAFRHGQPAEIQRIRSILAGAHPSGYAASCRAISNADLTERLVSVAVPTLVLVGAEDRSTTPEMAMQIHEHLPGSRYEVVPDAAHLTNLAAPELFNQAVARAARATSGDSSEPPNDRWAP
ncbi:MAG: hypothetical protein ACRDIY_13370, partial [Chloroflexota bacterium]